MVRVLLAVLAATVLLWVIPGSGASLAQAPAGQVTLRVEGMVWPLCEQTVQSVLQNVDGVVSAKANFRTGEAAVEYDPAQTGPDKLVEAVNSQTFYQARVSSENIKTVTLEIPGMTDQESAKPVIDALSSLDSETLVGGGLRPEGATFDYDIRQTSADQIVELINTQTAFTASVVFEEASAVTSVGSTATAVIRVEGMNDDETASQVTSSLFLDGIVDGSVNTDDATLTVVYDTNKLTAEEIVGTLGESLPYTVSLLQLDEGAAGGGGGIFSNLWVIVGLAGFAVVAFLAWPLLNRRFAQAGAGPKTPAGRRAASRRARRKR